MNSFEAKIRKQDSILICSGLGVILFGVWSIVRFILMRYLNYNLFAGIFDAIDDTELLEIVSRKTYENIVFIIVFFILVLDLCLRLYIGRSAINEGRGHLKKHSVYVVVTIIYACAMLGADINEIYKFINQQVDFDYLVNAIVDITTHIATVEIIISAIRKKILLKGQNPDQKVIS